MSRRRPPLPPSRLRTRAGRAAHPRADLTGDDDFVEFVVDEVALVRELTGLDTESALLELGCGPGRLALGLLLRDEHVAHYTGFEGDRECVEWSRRHLGQPDVEFIFDEVTGAEGPGFVGLPGHVDDRSYDVVDARALSFGAAMDDLSQTLRSLRHYVTDAGAILTSATADAGRVDIERTAHRAGLAVMASVGAESNPDGRRILVLGPGVVDRGKSSTWTLLAERAWQQRASTGLDAELHALTTAHEELSATAHELSQKLAARNELVADLRARLRRARSLNRRHEAVIAQLQRDLAVAQRPSWRRAVDRFAPSLRSSGPASLPSAAISPTEPVATSHTEPVLSSSAELPDNPQVGHGVASDVVVYTAISALQDRLPDVRGFAEPGVRFVCFSGTRPREANGWEIWPAEFYSVDARRVKLFYATHPHLLFPDQACSIWVDASVPWSRSPRLLQERLAADGHDVIARRRLGATLSDVAEAIVTAGGDDAPTVRQQMARYERAGFDLGNGLRDPSLLVRRHDAASIVALDTRWWAEIEQGSRQEILAFDFAAWVEGVEVGVLDDPDDGDADVVGDLVARARRYRRPRSTREAARLRAAWTIRRERPIDDSPSDCAPRPIDVVVPVHDALPLVQRCLQSVVDDSQQRGRLVVVDDGSAMQTREWLSAFAQMRDDVVLIRNAHATGFSAAANAGVDATSTAEVVVLNSDTVVPAGWTHKLARRLRAHEGLGLIGPVSNAAGWQSAPVVRDARGGLATNSLPPRCTLADVNDFLETLSADVVTPVVGTLNGFCLMLRREVVDTVGLFDAEAFPVGYGEENDLVLRAADAGFLCGVAPDTYVFHAKTGSFGAARRDELKARGQAVLRERYGRERLDRVAVSTRNHPVLEFVREALNDLYTPEIADLCIVPAGAQI